MTITEGLEEYVTIVEAGSISAAARKLELPLATLSRRLSALERELGVRLAHRSTRSLVLTEQGQMLYARARRIIEDAYAAREEVMRHDDVPRGTLRVSMPGGPGLWGGELVESFLESYPEVRVELLLTSRFVDMAAEQIDVVVRAGNLDDTSLVGRLLYSSRILCVATPTYLDRHGRPERPGDLANHECIRGFGGKNHPIDSWPLRDGGRVEVRGRLSTNDMLARWQALLHHQGVAMLPEILAAEALERGELEILLEDDLGDDIQIWVLYLEREFLAPKIRAFVNHLVAWSEHHQMTTPQMSC